MIEQERIDQVIYLLQEGMYTIADFLIEQYGMNMAETYKLAFPSSSLPVARKEPERYRRRGSTADNPMEV